MTEEDYIERIHDRWPAEGEDATQLISLAKAGVAAFPESAELQCLKGDLLQHRLFQTEQVWEDNPKAEKARAEILSCYERAVVLNPTLAEAYESIGYFYDTIENDVPSAEEPFEKAVELGGEADSHVGLARVRVQLGHDPDEVIAWLEESPYADAPEVVELIEEIRNGDWSPLDEDGDDEEDEFDDEDDEDEDDEDDDDDMDDEDEEED